jgi:hypothetical protein
LEEILYDHTIPKTGNFLNLERKGRKIYIFVHPQKGVPSKKAEIIPIEPDTDNAVEGILSSF